MFDSVRSKSYAYVIIYISSLYMHILRMKKMYIVNHQIHGTARKSPDKAKPPKLKLATTYLLEPSSATRCWLVRWLVSMIKNSSSNNNSSNNNNHNHNHNIIIIILIIINNNMNHNHNHNHNYNHSESRLPKLGGLPAPSNKHGKLSSCWSVSSTPVLVPPFACPTALHLLGGCTQQPHPGGWKSKICSKAFLSCALWGYSLEFSTKMTKMAKPI